MDNIIKVVADALNGLAYKDDAYIVNTSCIKRWTEEKKGYVKVTIKNV
jgi:Holliday junction resolvase RusA-like endonuclease